MLQLSSTHPKKINTLIVFLLVIMLCASGGIVYILYHQNFTKTAHTVQIAKPAKPSNTPTTNPPKPAIASPAPMPTSSIKPTSTPCTDNTAKKLLIISVSQQHMWACKAGTLVNQSAVTTGATQAPNGVDDATDIGTWHIYSKMTNQHLRGSDVNGSWDDFVQYWIPFDGPIGFHDASWQTFSFGSSDYKTHGSHGCVHLPLNIIRWLYDWAPIGTAVETTL